MSQQSMRPDMIPVVKKAAAALPQMLMTMQTLVQGSLQPFSLAAAFVMFGLTLMFTA
jgi:hypothetical protein